MTEQVQAKHGIRLMPGWSALPANLLRLHIVFETPPDVELAVSSARLLDANNAEIAHAFLDLPGGLWSADGLRLTLIMHPGRIKSGLIAQAAEGAAIEAGHDYMVEIDGGYDVVLLPLKVGPVVTTGIDTSSWRLTSPKVGTTEPVIIRFDRVMDPASVEVGLIVRDRDGRAIEGAWFPELSGLSAHFVPAFVWRHGEIILVTHSDLEDIAGNRPNMAFETKRPLELEKRVAMSGFE